ncbi:hypothetical protein DE146DRAFT_784469 [Phaeosphaeria sp. MPI-PUGE-AT-0046c]|nr:hypothetical protein DE146DRAFT_784469 [Phaeosphaeria sp. MPI-PUGE-AT-0046c]
MGPLPDTISFVLPGRRTLSEHLPAETIDVSTNIVRRSNYLIRMIVQQGLTLPSTWEPPVPNIDPIGFRMYIEWLKTGHIEFKVPVASGDLLLRDSFDLIFTHIAGSQLEEPDFQDYIIDTMTKLLDVSQTPDMGVLEAVFLENGASNVLKQFVVDKMFAMERRMLGMIRGRADDAEERQRDTGCKYHVHAPGECYRGRLQDASRDSPELSHVGHQRPRSNTLINNSEHPNPISTCPSSSSSDSLISTISESTNYNMTYDPYFDSPEWPRKVHGLERRNTTLDLHMNKPLPSIPPLTLGSSPTTPASPSFLARASPPSQGRSRSDSDSTQQLIFEYLRRLSTDEGVARRSSESTVDFHRAAIPDLVLECLKRFKSSNKDGASSGTAPSTRIPSPYYMYNRSPLPILREQSPPLAPNVPSSFPGTERLVYGEKSHDILPKPWPELGAHTTGSSESHSESADQQACPAFRDQPTSRYEHAESTMIKRKTAPPRGTDWLNQYDRINDMMRDNSIGVAKRSRGSRFRELLRSESRLGSVQLEN